MQENSHPIDKMITGTTTVVGSLVFFGTIAFFALAPVAGALFAGATALQATAASGFALQAIATVAAGAGGLLAGLMPVTILNHFGKKKDPSYGMLELMCVPAAIANKALTKSLSPLKHLKLSPLFKRATEKENPADPAPKVQDRNRPPQP